ncbi:inorganic pyrophosphatase [Acutalibacter muris]|jgi:inorganic pyrophosphatase|uniref:inorganic pyrophosphatase n=1 Tax=Acutalibacter muris TaxID=1796620 RepID=UPI003FA413CE
MDMPKIGDTITIKIDRPMGTAHPKHPDGEEQDAYVLGVDEPLTEFTGRLIAVIHRFDDVEEKWVLAPEGRSFTKKQIVELTHFQEQYYHTEVRT